MDAPKLIGRRSKTWNRAAGIFQNPVIAKISKQETGINPLKIRNEIIKLGKKNPAMNPPHSNRETPPEESISTKHR
jgi:hypothetical protein